MIAMGTLEMGKRGEGRFVRGRKRQAGKRWQRCGGNDMLNLNEEGRPPVAFPWATSPRLGATFFFEFPGQASV